MSAGFTKGPWIVSPEDDYFVIAYPEGVAIIIADLDPIGQRAALEMEANANLIAAAPALYEALAEAWPYVDASLVILRGAEDEERRAKASSLLVKIRAALKQARGEQ